MEKLRDVFGQMLNVDLIQMTLSNSRDADRAGKIKIRPVLLKGEILFQETTYRGTQVFHKNYTGGELLPRLTEYMETLFKQAELKGKREEATVLVGKKGTVTVKRKKCPEGESKADTNAGSLSHNRTKRYILQEGQPVDFLIGLGVQTPDGKIAKARYDKFRQINRYLEFIEDVLDRLPSDRTLRIVDFGCGKSYLTFAMYYYLKILKHYDVDMIGLDLKEEVIRYCNELSKKYGYENLHFYQGDIKDFDRAENVDMVVSLHACDTATDYALARGIKWGAGVILAVPCCQHELNGQMQCDALESVFSYGLIRERSAALFTDALRAALLEAEGYDTQILEFIDMEHTPKNIMIRGILRNRDAKSETEQRYRMQKRQKAAALMTFLHVFPTLDRLLRE